MTKVFEIICGLNFSFISLYIFLYSFFRSSLCDNDCLRHGDWIRLLSGVNDVQKMPDLLIETNVWLVHICMFLGYHISARPPKPAHPYAWLYYNVEFFSLYSSFAPVNIIFSLYFHRVPRLENWYHNVISMVPSMEIKFTSIALLDVVNKMMRMMNLLTEHTNVPLIFMLQSEFCWFPCICVFPFTRIYLAYLDWKLSSKSIMKRLNKVLLGS